MAELANKMIVIDISIYLYKYQTEGALIENIYLMLSIFKYYNVIPIFIFDGKPPAEKKELLRKRYSDKVNAEAEYNRLKALYADADSTHSQADKNRIVSLLDGLKKKIVYITKKQIEDVKSLINAFGATYYDAPNEADELCASFVIKNKAWACMSEDMDMFVYGVPRVIRYFSLLNHTIVLYNTSNILYELSITEKEFSEICVLSGTDYNIVDNKTNITNKYTLYDALNLFKQFQLSQNSSFYEWLYNNNIVTEHDYNILIQIYQMFAKLNEANGYIIENIKIQPELIVCKKKLIPILEADGFIFAKPVCIN